MRRIRSAANPPKGSGQDHRPWSAFVSRRISSSRVVAQVRQFVCNWIRELLRNRIALTGGSPPCPIRRSTDTKLDPESQRIQVRRAALGSAIGTTIEWYDFFLYNTAAALIFPHVFFPASSAYAGAMQSFATYAVGFAARPVGAAIFGHWGDRIGRKTTLIITLLVMGIASAVVGFLPGTASIGFAAPLILVILRLVQGIAIGGEWSGSVLLAMEWGDQDRRGLLGSAAQIGVPVGLVLGTGGMTLLSATLVARGVQLLGLAGAVHCQPGAGGGRPGDPAEDSRDADVRQGAGRRENREYPGDGRDPAALAGDPALGGCAVQRADAVLPVHHLRADLCRCDARLQQDVCAHCGPRGRVARTCDDPAGSRTCPTGSAASGCI